MKQQQVFFIIKAAEHWGDLAELNPTQSVPQQVLHTRGEDQQRREGFFHFFHNSSLFSSVCVIIRIFLV
jgi:hypothetical protein